MIGVDPVDDCTFWYTTEYYAVTSTNVWQTRIGRFRFPACVTADFTVTATPDYLFIPRGGTGPTTITVQSLNSFNDAVNLSCPTPGRFTCVFSPSSVTPPPNAAATSTLTITVNGSPIAGEYWLPVEATSGALTRRILIVVAVE